VVLTDELIEAASRDHAGVLSDKRRRELNLSMGKTLCERCDGTGNEFYFMYSPCSDCAGHGFIGWSGD
jgi:DnaJ-class molecular chaperone